MNIPPTTSYPGRCYGCLNDHAKQVCPHCDPSQVKWAVRMSDGSLIHCNGDLEDVMQLFNFNNSIFPDLPITLVPINQEES